MKIETKFKIGEKFIIHKDYRKVMCVTKDDVFRVDYIKIDKHGIYYAYYKFPEHKNRAWNKKWRTRHHIAEFAMQKIK